MNREQILGIVRHILTGAGAIVVLKGYTDEATITMVIGALITTIGGIWSIFDKKEANTLAKAKSILERRAE